jgi:hypothetical protein
MKAQFPASKNKLTTHFKDNYLPTGTKPKQKVTHVPTAIYLSNNHTEVFFYRQLLINILST